ncbi:MAG: transporter substrate-binding domain-containing protein, partial [Oscillospiraceae bacterium]
MRCLNVAKKTAALILAFLILFSIICLSGCSNEKKDIIKNVEQLNSPGYSICVNPGSAAALTAIKSFPNAEIVYNNAISDGYLAVEQEKSDAFVFGKLYMQYAIGSESLDDLVIMNETLDEVDIAVGVNPKKESLLSDINRFIKQFKEDGTYEDMYSRWIVKANKTMPKIEKPTNPTVTLKIGTAGLVEPMTYFDGNQELTGFDIEFINRLGLFLNADIQLEAMSFEALIASLETGKLDAVVSDLNITEERKQVILMSDPYMK